MAERIRQVRRKFRKEVLKAIEEDNGNTEHLMAITEMWFEQRCSFHDCKMALLRSELSNAVGHLRNAGLVETVWKKWKTDDTLDDKDVEIVSCRRTKRLYGELVAEVELHQRHGRGEEAAKAAEILLSFVEQAAPNRLKEAESFLVELGLKD